MNDYHEQVTQILYFLFVYDYCYFLLNHANAIGVYQE